MFRDLGVTLDASLTPKKHISKLRQVSFFQLRQLRRAQKCFTNALTAELLHAFVMCRWDYCNSIVHGLPVTRVKQLQAVLNASARLVTGTCRFDDITLFLNLLHWLSYPTFY